MEHGSQRSPLQSRRLHSPMVGPYAAAAIDPVSPYRGVPGLLFARRRAGPVQHLAAEQFQSAVRRRRRVVAAKYPCARRSQQLHLRLSRYRRQQSACPRIPPKSRRPRSRWRISTGPLPRPSAVSSGSGMIRPRASCTAASNSAGPTTARSSTRCWCCRAPAARRRRWRFTAAPRAPLTTQRATRSVSLPTRRLPMPRPRAIVSVSPTGRLFGSSCSAS